MIFSLNIFNMSFKHNSYSKYKTDMSHVKKGSLLEVYLGHHKNYTEQYGSKLVVLMNVGSFYELYGVINDEVSVGPPLYEIADLLNVQVAKKDKRVLKVDFKNHLMIGWPEIAILKYKRVLVNNGYTTVTVDQVTPSPNPERAVTEIMSPSTASDEYGSGSRDSNHLVSIYVEVYPTAAGPIFMSGLSAIDIGTGKNYVHSIVSTVKDTKLWSDEIFRLLHNYNPSEVVLHYKDISETELVTLCHSWSLDRNKVLHNFCKSKEFLKPSYQNEFYRKVYPETGMLDSASYLGFERLPEVLMSHIYMIQFIHEHKIDNIREIQKPIFSESHQHLVLSHNCMYQLYLVDTTEHSQERYSSLLSLLNRCQTAVGRRLCKERLLYPILDKDILRKRYQVLGHFVDHELYTHCRPHLAKIHDIEKSFRKMGLGILHPYEFASLHQSLTYLNYVHDALGRLYSAYHTENSGVMDKLREFQAEYQRVFSIAELEDYSLTTMEKSVFREGIYPELDSINQRCIRKQGMLQSIADALGKFIDSKPDMIKVSYSDKFGWYLYTTVARGETMTKRLSKYKEEQIEIVLEGGLVLPVNKSDIATSTRGSNCIIGLELIEKTSHTIICLQKKILSMNREKYLEYLETFFKEYKTCFLRTVAYLGETDLNSAISKISVENSYCRPQIDDESTTSYLDAKEIRHPIVEKVQVDQAYVPNDVKLDSSGMLLFGTNACGKSTLMKSIGLTVIMAQAGFFVPCSEFTYSPYTQIFTRILNNDNIFNGQSSFAIEMSELRAIKQRANENSLVLGDELCSGTENVSAISIVSAGLKTLSDKKCSFVFTSHLHQLMKVSVVQAIDNLRICHLKIRYDQEKDLLIYDRTLAPGSGPPIYGLEVCKAMDLGTDFVALARQVQLEITGSNQTLLNDKKSNYNKDVFMDRCQVCQAKAEETDHIQEQHIADKNGMIGRIHKNIKSNLVPLCKSCHKQKHHGNLKIYGYQMTGSGIKLRYEYMKPQVHKSTKKYSEKDVKTILTYKDQVLGKTMKQTHCIKTLELEHGIKISAATLKKILGE
jgi:DNA mismatch repair protein MutS